MGESGGDQEPVPGEQGPGAEPAPAYAGERVGSLLAGLASRSGEAKRRCRTVLQSRAEALLPESRRPANAHPTLALV